jgi:hypothetical protein
MSLFLGPFGIIAAAVAVVLESWVFVKIFVGSFLIKGMIGEEIFEAVPSPLSPQQLTEIGPSTTFKGIHPWSEIQNRDKHQPCRSSNKSSPIL